MPSMTLSEALDVVAQRNRAAMAQYGHRGNEQERMEVELATIRDCPPMESMIHTAEHFYTSGFSFRESVHRVLAVAVRYGVDVGKLLQSANAERPQPIETTEESANTKAQSG